MTGLDLPFMGSNSPGNPCCSRCGHSFSRHEPHGRYECNADIGGAPCECPGFAHIWRGQQRAAADCTPPDPKERQEAGLEVHAAVLAILAGDLHRLNEILFGSERPAHTHALEAMFGAAFMVGQSDQPGELLDAWRNNILGIEDAPRGPGPPPDGTLALLEKILRRAPRLPEAACRGQAEVMDASTGAREHVAKAVADL